MDINKQAKTVLYFTRNSMLTDAEQAEAVAIRNAHNVNVRIRNGGVPVNGGVELCDGVAGHAPEEYRKRFPVFTSDGATNEAQPTTTNASGTSAPQAPGETSPAVTPLVAEIGSVKGGWGN